MNKIDQKTDEAAIRELIVNWAKAVCAKDLNGILANHSPEILMFDVPPPLQSKGIRRLQEKLGFFLFLGS